MRIPQGNPETGQGTQWIAVSFTLPVVMGPLKMAAVREGMLGNWVCQTQRPEHSQEMWRQEASTLLQDRMVTVERSGFSSFRSTWKDAALEYEDGNITALLGSATSVHAQPTVLQKPMCSANSHVPHNFSLQVLKILQQMQKREKPQSFESLRMQVGRKSTVS